MIQMQRVTLHGEEKTITIKAIRHFKDSKHMNKYLDKLRKKYEIGGIVYVDRKDDDSYEVEIVNLKKEIELLHENRVSFELISQMGVKDLLGLRREINKKI